MPFSRPTLATIVDRVQADIETRLPGADARLRRTPEHAIGRSVSGVAHGLHGHLRYVADQIIADTAESAYLRRQASAYGITPKDPSAAEGTITLTGTPASTCPSGTVWQRSDGTEYTLDSLATIGGGGSVSAAITASDPGASPNTDTGTTLSLQSPVAGIDSDATVEDPGIRNGTNAESDESLLARLLLRRQTPPSGGGPGDYVKWAFEVAGVTRAWEYPKALGAGTVLVRFMTDDATADGIPTGAKVTEVQAYLDARAPLTATVTALAPIASPFDPTIEILPDTAAVRAAVEAELEDLILRRSEPGGLLYLSQVDEAISRAAGEQTHDLTVPTDDVQEATGYITTMGTITWV